MEHKNIESVIAFLDILGFKKYIYDNDIETVANVFSIIDKSTAVAKNELKITMNSFFSDKYKNTDEEVIKHYNESLEDLKVYIMSDSVVIFTPRKYPESLAVVADTCNSIQQELFKLDKPVLLRGAFAIGEIKNDNNTIFGKGLVEAYVSQELHSVYPRIIISNKLLEGNKLSIDPNYNEIVDCDGYKRLDSIEKLLGIDKKTKWDDVENSNEYKLLLNMINDNLYDYADDHIRKKYIWIKQLLERKKMEMRARDESLLDLGGLC